MKYLLVYTQNDFENDSVEVLSEEYDDFEELMTRFALFSSAKDRVLVIDRKTKKVLCLHERQGQTTFNNSLLEG